MNLRPVLYVLLFCGSAAIPLHAQNALERSVLGSGGSAMSGGSYRITATVGQVAVGTATSSGWIAGQGFWYQVLSRTTDVTESPAPRPEYPVLDQNYPNPFNPSTTIEFVLPRAAHVRLEVFGPSGQRIGVLIDDQKRSGRHRVHFEAGRLPAGLYTCRFISGNRRIERKMLLLK